MSSRIRFIFERGGELVADLLSEAAPKTVERVLEVLPLETTVYHTRWCGREIYFSIKSKSQVPRENQTATANTGDVIYWREWETEENPPEALSIYYGGEVIRDHRLSAREPIRPYFPRPVAPDRRDRYQGLAKGDREDTH